MGKTSLTSDLARLFGKIFLFAFLPAALFIGCVSGVFVLALRTIASVGPQYGMEISWDVSNLSLLWPLPLLFMGLIGLAWLISSILHIAAVRRMPYGKQPGALDTHQARRLELKLPYDKTFDLCLEAIAKRGGTVYSKQPERGKIEGQTGDTTKNWCTLSLDVVKLDAKTTRVTISSRPLYGSVALDMGKNLENVNSIADFLKLKEEQALAA